MKTYGRTKNASQRRLVLLASGVLVVIAVPAPHLSRADDAKPTAGVASSYDQIAPVLLGKESFSAVMTRDKADKAAVMARQQKVLDERYDLAAHGRQKSDHDARQADSGWPDGPAAGRNDVGKARRHVERCDSRQGAVSQRLPAACPIQSSWSAAWSLPRLRSSNLPGWPASTSTLTCPIIFCRSFRRRFF